MVKPNHGRTNGADHPRRRRGHVAREQEVCPQPPSALSHGLLRQGHGEHAVIERRLGLVFLDVLEQVRRRYEIVVVGYVVMPEHFHLLWTEPERGSGSSAMQALKQAVSRKIERRTNEPFWQRRFYDFNVWTEAKRIEKLRYMHRNPVKRGLVSEPEDWAWSSFRHYVTGEDGGVDIESSWTARRREQLGIYPPVCRTGPL